MNKKDISHILLVEFCYRYYQQITQNDISLIPLLHIVDIGDLVLETSSMSLIAYHKNRIGYLESNHGDLYQIKTLDGTTHDWDNASFISLTKLFNVSDGEYNIIEKIKELL